MFNAARCNDARRYNAPTSPPGGRMPLVRSDPRADSNSIPLPLLLPPPSPSRPTEKCVRTCSVKKDEELDRLDSHRWRRRTKRGRNALNEDALHDALIYRIFFFFFTIIRSKKIHRFSKGGVYSQL